MILLYIRVKYGSGNRFTSAVICNSKKRLITFHDAYNHEVSPQAIVNSYAIINTKMSMILEPFSYK